MKSLNVLQNNQDAAIASRTCKGKWRQLFLRRMRKIIHKMGDKVREYYEEPE